MSYQLYINKDPIRFNKNYECQKRAVSLQNINYYGRLDRLARKIK